MYGTLCGGLKKRCGSRISYLGLYNLEGSPTFHGGAGGKESNAIAKSRDGNGTKIHALVDALGDPVEILLAGANVHDSVSAADFIKDRTSNYFIVDKAYDSNAIREVVKANGAEAVIPSHGRRAQVYDVDWHIYKERHLVECFFQRIKSWRRIAMRYEKMLDLFGGMVRLACILIWLKF